MNRKFFHKLGICTFLENEDTAALKKWMNWHRRRGVDFFYLYASFDITRLRADLERESSNGLLNILQVMGLAGSKGGLFSYKDCLQRARYFCERIAFLKVGEYLETEVVDLQESVSNEFTYGIAAIAVSVGEEQRYIADPLLIHGFTDTGELIPHPYGGAVKAAENMTITHRAPARRIALLSHVLARNGAPMALLTVAKILLNAGYEVDTYSVVHGPLESEFEAIGASVVVDPSIQAPLADQPWYGYYDLIFVNTAVMVSCFWKPLTETPVLWWLHESPSILEMCHVTSEALAMLQKDKVITVTVSRVARDAFLALRPDWPVSDNLVLGVADNRVKRKEYREKNDAPYIFMMVATFEERKGQDVLLEAIGKLSPEERKRCEFWMIGKRSSIDKSTYYDDVNALASEYPEVKIINFQPHEKILEMYGQSDVVVVPSREETLSIVAVESMMIGIPCILADRLGVSYYAENGKNALLFETGSSDSLAETLRKVINEPETVRVIGENGRQLYEKMFSLDSFRNKLLKLVDGCITKDI